MSDSTSFWNFPAKDNPGNHGKSNSYFSTNLTLSTIRIISVNSSVTSVSPTRSHDQRDPVDRRIQMRSSKSESSSGSNPAPRTHYLPFSACPTTTRPQMNLEKPNTLERCRGFGHDGAESDDYSRPEEPTRLLIRYGRRGLLRVPQPRPRVPASDGEIERRRPPHRSSDGTPKGTEARIPNAKAHWRRSHGARSTTRWNRTTGG